MPSTLRQIAREPHETPIAPDIVPADWADCVPNPANDALSREKLFAEIRNAAEIAAPAVDTTFRATDVNDIPAKRKRSSSRPWMRRVVTVFVLALVSAVATAAWKHHGDTALQAATNWAPLSGANSSAAGETPATPDQVIEAAAPAATAQPAAPAPAAAGTAALPPGVEQQIQSMTRDLAAMGQQIEQLKASIEALRANQPAVAVETAPPVARAPASKPPQQPKVTALPPRPVAPPVATPPRPAAPPAMQATTVPAPPAATASPTPYQPPPQAMTQPNGEPIPRPPMPMPLSDRYER